MFSCLRGNKNDAFQHTHPTSAFLCCRKDSGAQSVPGSPNPPWPHALGDHQSSEGTGAPTQTTHPTRSFRHTLETAASAGRVSLLGKHRPTHPTPLQAWEAQQNHLTALLSPKSRAGSVLRSGRQTLPLGHAQHQTTRIALAIATVMLRSLLTRDTHLPMVFCLLLVIPKPLPYRLYTTILRNSKAATRGSLGLSAGLKTLPTASPASTTRCHALARPNLAPPPPTHT